MAKELNEDTGFTVSIKTLAGIGVSLATIIWYLVKLLCHTTSYKAL